MEFINIAIGILLIIIGYLGFNDIHKDTKKGYKDTYGGNIKMYFGGIGLMVVGVVLLIRSVLDLI
jgi:uncharacterized membrane protein YidH (DUF202 family)